MLLPKDQRVITINDVELHEIRFYKEEQRIQAVRVVELNPGQVHKTIINITDSNGSDWKAIFEAFTEDQIDAVEEAKQNEELQKKKQEDQAAAQVKAKLFSMKAAAFEIEEVANSDDRELKRRIRRAKTEVEVNVLASVLVMKELLKNEN